jgi:hypothetical protein
MESRNSGKIRRDAIKLAEAGEGGPDRVAKWLPGSATPLDKCRL